MVDSQPHTVARTVV